MTIRMLQAWNGLHQQKIVTTLSGSDEAALVAAGIATYDLDGPAENLRMAQLATDSSGNVTGLVGPDGKPINLDFDIRQWCSADGVADDSASFLTALTEANGRTITIPSSATVNLASQVTYTGSVRINGGGSIKHTRDGGLYVTQNITSLGSVSSTSTVALPVGFSSANTSQMVLASDPPASVVRGSILMICSDDSLPEKAGAYLAELVRVQDVTGSTITLSELLEFPYSTAVVAYLLDESVVDISGVTFFNPNYLTENNGKAGAALTIEVCVRPSVSCKFNQEANAALQVISCWMPSADVTVDNGRNNHTNSSYGYGIVLSSATTHGRFKIRSTNNRHAVTGGPTASSQAKKKGATRQNMVYDSEAIAPLSAGFDTHEGQYHTRFVNCFVKKQIGNPDYTSETTLYDFTDRGAGTQFINCGSFGNGGISLAGAACNRLGSAGKYTTRLVNHIIDGDILSPSTGLRVAAGYNATVAGYHEVEIVGGVMRRTAVTFSTGAPRITVDGLDLREQDASFDCGGSNIIVLRNVKRRRGSTLPNILIKPSTTLTIDGYYVNATGYSNSTLVYATGGVGTATVKWGRAPVAETAVPTTLSISDGTTTLSASLLAGPLRITAKGTTASRPTLASWEVGQSYLDTTLAANGKPITWSGSAWVDSTGASV